MFRRYWLLAYRLVLHVSILHNALNDTNKNRKLNIASSFALYVCSFFVSAKNCIVFMAQSSPSASAMFEFVRCSL